MPDPISATVAAVSSVGSAAISSRGAKKLLKLKNALLRKRSKFKETFLKDKQN